MLPQRASLFASPLLAGILLQTPHAAPERWMLVYAGFARSDRPAYDVTDLIHLLSVVDTSGSPTSWLCSGVVLLEFHAPSGGYYMPWQGGGPARGGDWTAYLDSVFRRGGPVERLESAAAMIGRAAGAPQRGVALALMIPYPDPRSDTLQVAGRRYDMRAAAGRRDAVAAYVKDAVGRFAALHPSHVSLAGFYWLNEAAPAADAKLLRDVATRLHRQQLRFLWIPYYGATGAEQWKVLGFDEVWLQPNYFFHPEVPVARFDTAVARARTTGMGLELEFDRRLFDSGPFADRLDPYLTVIEDAPDLQRRSIVIYEGAGALIQLARSKDAWHRAMYERLVEVLKP